jgi:hypothetical protein
LKDCSEYKQEQLKEAYMADTLVPQLKRVCAVIAGNDSVFLVGDKV